MTQKKRMKRHERTVGNDYKRVIMLYSGLRKNLSSADGPDVTQLVIKAP